MIDSRARAPARSRAFCSAFSRLGYDLMVRKIDRRRRWKSHRKPWHLTGAKVSMGGHDASTCVDTRHVVLCATGGRADGVELGDSMVAPVNHLNVGNPNYTPIRYPPRNKARRATEQQSCRGL